MTTVAHISDLHFGSEDPALTEALIEDLNRAALGLVIISGDLTLAARTSEFRAARRFIDALEAPTLAVPGNHDITPYQLSERFLAPYRRFARSISSDLEPTFVTDEMIVVGVNTARRAMPRLNWANGSISRRQIRHVAARLDAAPPRAIRIVVAHHPFLGEAEATQTKPLVRRAARALACFTERGVDLVTSGHLHRTYTAAFQDMTITTTPPQDASPLARSRPVTILQAGTALSGRRRGEPNSYNRITIEPDGGAEVRAIVWNGEHWAPSDVVLARVAPR